MEELFTHWSPTLYLHVSPSMLATVWWLNTLREARNCSNRFTNDTIVPNELYTAEFCFDLLARAYQGRG